MIRLAKSAAEAALGAAWGDSDHPPWLVGNEHIEVEKVRLLAEHLRGTKTLADCGCGGGDFVELLLRTTGHQFARVDGIDLAAGALERAGRTGIYNRLVRGFIDEAPQLLGGDYDIVLVSDVLYYVEDYLASLSALVDLVAPGGKIFVSLAIGGRYFDAREAALARALLAKRGLVSLVSRELDYTLSGVPRRRIPAHRLLWAQTHKTVDIYQRP